MNWSQPTLAGFQEFVYDYMLVPPVALPNTSPWPSYAYARAKALVFCLPTIPAPEYAVALYNCAGHILLAIAPDANGQIYFAEVRKKFNLNNLVSGVPSNASDQGTGAGLVVPSNFENLTVSDLNFLQTPYGREYIGYAQDFGQIAGLT